MLDLIAREMTTPDRCPRLVALPYQGNRIRLMLPLMRLSPLFVVLLAAGCHGAPRPGDPARVSQVAKMDSATVRQICESPDSVIAGTKDCVLLYQGRPSDRQRFQPPPAPQ
jgi:hypothetical protein